MVAMHLRIPPALVANCPKSAERCAWLNSLPALLHDLQQKWSLTVDDPFDAGEASCSYVVPVLRVDGTSAVLKLAMPHMEGLHEMRGLRFWDGDPTVHLYEADEDRNAMLLERCRPGVLLRTVPEPEQDAIVAGLLRRLWRQPPPPHPFRPLSALTAYWSRETLAHIHDWPDAGLVREGLRLFQELPRTAPTQVLLATDLHAGNVLRAEREPWLVIDPKPFLGDPAYDATQHLFNCQLRLRSNPDSLIQKFADLLGVDHHRVRLWMFARAAAEPRDDWRDPAWADLARAVAP
jgi:streptomycin 6-kinase